MASRKPSHVYLSNFILRQRNESSSGDEISPPAIPSCQKASGREGGGCLRAAGSTHSVTADENHWVFLPTGTMIKPLSRNG